MKGLGNDCLELRWYVELAKECQKRGNCVSVGLGVEHGIVVLQKRRYRRDARSGEHLEQVEPSWYLLTHWLLVSEKNHVRSMLEEVPNLYLMLLVCRNVALAATLEENRQADREDLVVSRSVLMIFDSMDNTRKSVDWRLCIVYRLRDHSKTVVDLLSVLFRFA